MKQKKEILRGRAKNPWAVHQGRKGAYARAAALTPERRLEISKRAIAARWKGHIPIKKTMGEAAYKRMRYQIKKNKEPEAVIVAREKEIVKTKEERARADEAERIRRQDAITEAIRRQQLEN